MSEKSQSLLYRPELPITADEERKLRTLVNEIARDIVDEDKLLHDLGISRNEFEELGQTRLFREMLAQAQAEWVGASNTHKRVKLKAAMNIEEALPSLYNGMVDVTEPLSSRVKAFEIMARIGGLGNPEPTAAMQGSSFQLTIHYADNKPPIIIENSPDPQDLGQFVGRGAIPGSPLSVYSQSNVFDDAPDDDLGSLPE